MCNLKNKEVKNEQKRNNLDKLILNDPLQSLNQVQDSRTMVYGSVDGADSWANKQCGL